MAEGKRGDTGSVYSVWQSSSYLSELEPIERDPDHRTYTMNVFFSRGCTSLQELMRIRLNEQKEHDEARRKAGKSDDERTEKDDVFAFQWFNDKAHRTSYLPVVSLHEHAKHVAEKLRKAHVVKGENDSLLCLCVSLSSTHRCLDGQVIEWC